MSSYTPSLSEVKTGTAEAIEEHGTLSFSSSLARPDFLCHAGLPAQEGHCLQ